MILNDVMEYHLLPSWQLWKAQPLQMLNVLAPFESCPQQLTMEALEGEEGEEHVHCATCFRATCSEPSRAPDSCAVVACEMKCGARLHKCKQRDHLEVMISSTFRPHHELCQPTEIADVLRTGD